MENNIQTNNALNLVKAVKNLFFLLIAIIPFGFGLYIGITDADNPYNMTSIIILGLALSLILMGFFSNKKKHDSGILAGIGILLSALSMGVYFTGSILIFLG